MTSFPSQMLDRADIHSQSSLSAWVSKTWISLNSNKQPQESSRKNMHDLTGETETRMPAWTPHPYPHLL